MTVTPASLKSTFAEFAGKSDPYVQTFIDQASRRVNANVFASMTDDATAWLACHLMSKAAQAARFANGQGHSSSITVGNLSKSIDTSYGMVPGGTDYQTTPYGQQFKTMLRMVCPTPVLT